MHPNLHSNSNSMNSNIEIQVQELAVETTGTFDGGVQGEDPMINCPVTKEMGSQGKIPMRKGTDEDLGRSERLPLPSLLISLIYFVANIPSKREAQEDLAKGYYRERKEAILGKYPEIAGKSIIGLHGLDLQSLPCAYMGIITLICRLCKRTSTDEHSAPHYARLRNKNWPGVSKES